MTLIPYDWTLARELRRNLDVLTERPTALIPRVDSQALEDRYVLRADLPGVRPENIEITAAEGVLTVKAQRHFPSEQRSVPMQRRFSLPEDADVDAIQARSQHGVLEISVSKVAKAAPRRIQIEAA
jgi:HSP20 family protein